MSADVLRKAAALMRERAEAAGPNDPWFTSDDDANTPEDAEHIASWHPAVALAVADWLDATAVRVEAAREPKDGGARNHGWRGSRQALAVARAYLGSDA